MSKHSGLPKQANVSLKDKFSYIDFMNGRNDYMEVNGRMFMIGGTFDSETFQKIDSAALVWKKNQIKSEKLRSGSFYTDFLSQLPTLSTLC